MYNVWPTRNSVMISVKYNVTIRLTTEPAKRIINDNVNVDIKRMQPQ